MLIKTLIRKKRLALAESQQKLNYLRLRERRQKELVDLQNARIKQERQRWNSHLAEKSELSVQQLILARAYVGKIEQHLHEMNTEMGEQSKAILRLENHSKRANKEIEKLEDIAQERSQQQHLQMLQQEWLALDQWVINCKGGRT